MAGTVTTSLVVQFGDTGDEQYHLTAEIDSRPTGFNGGNTTFIGGDSPVFLVYKSPELSLSFITSRGGIQSAGTGVETVEEWLIFANEKTKSLSKPPKPNSNVTLEFYGGVPNAQAVGQEVTLSTPGVAVYKATYETNFYAYRMTNIPVTINNDTSFQVIVVITGTAS